MDSAAPWLTSWAPLHGDLVCLCESGMSVTQALNELLAARAPIELAAGPLRFVDQDELPAGAAYEAFITRTGRVPTRNSTHDLYNGMAWLRYPLVKRRLNELQAAVIARKGVGPTRGPLRDALTLFDENGAWLQAPEVLLDALRQRDWHRLFVTRRAEWAQARLTLFGHALLEKLAQPRKGITAHVWCLPPGASPDEEVAVLRLLQPDRMAARDYLPLPVLGVPGWWPANDDPSFYDDTTVFRPLPRAGVSPTPSR